MLQRELLLYCELGWILQFCLFIFSMLVKVIGLVGRLNSLLLLVKLQVCEQDLLCWVMLCCRLCYFFLFSGCLRCVGLGLQIGQLLCLLSLWFRYRLRILVVGVQWVVWLLWYLEWVVVSLYFQEVLVMWLLQLRVLVQDILCYLLLLLFLLLIFLGENSWYQCFRLLLEVLMKFGEVKDGLWVLFCRWLKLNSRLVNSLLLLFRCQVLLVQLLQFFFLVCRVQQLLQYWLVMQ